MEDDNWSSIFSNKISEYFGSVREIEEAVDLIEEFAYATHTNYTVLRANRNFGKFNLTGHVKNNSDEETHHIRFEDIDNSQSSASNIPYNGIPFMVVGKKWMACHQGPSRNTICTKESNSDHSSYKQAAHKRKHCGTKKLGCEAIIMLREVLTFPQYKLETDTLHSRRNCSAKLRADLNSPNYDEVVVERHIYIDLPKQSKHSNHIMGEAADLKAPIDGKVTGHINKLVNEGITNVLEMKRHVRMFVKTNFQESTNCINRRFHPSRADIRNLIYREKKRNMKGLADQEYIREKISEWKTENPEDLWFYRACNDKEDDKLLIVHQSAWQKKLLIKYGEEIVYLDATYKTTKYTIPLFFLCIQTNCGYCVVGIIIVQSENSQSLAEGLKILKSNCHDSNWHPKAFMVDCSDIEQNAIKECFPDCNILVCDFHRKQAWLRWLNARKNGVADDQKHIMALLNAVAESTTEEEYRSNLNNLRSSTIWQENASLRNYIDRQWVAENKYKKWVRAFRLDYTIATNTNNGVEAKNKVFKNDYLHPTRATSLTAMLRCIVEEFLPDSLRNYLEANVTMGKGWRATLDSIPKDLHHKSSLLLRHMREMSIKAANANEEVVQIDNKNYKVQSMTKHNSYYKLSLGDEENMPKCECKGFAKNHMICKHFALVFQRYNLSWNNLPDQYRRHPLFNIDVDIGFNNVGPSQNQLIQMERSLDENASDMIEDDQESEEPPITRNDIRSLLQEMQNITYMVDNINLKPIKDTLSMAKEELLKLVPRNDGLPTEHVDSTDLPKRRKYKKKSQLQKGNRDEEKDSEILEIEYTDMGMEVTLLHNVD